MASKTVVELFDDLDGGRADETVCFALDGVEYEIDLSKTNATALRDVFADYVEHGHRVTGRSRGVTKNPVPAAVPTAVPVAAAPVAAVSVPPATSGKKAKGKGKSTVNPNATMTAEIRRLASESARKVSEANQAAEAAAVVSEDIEPDLFTTAPDVVAEPRNGESVGPVPALVIPFQEAGL